MLTDEALEGLADAIVAVLGVEEDGEVEKRARAQVQVLNRQVFSYTRGAGYADGVPNADIVSVLISAGARWASNPAMNDSESESSPVLRYGPGGQPVPGEEPLIQSVSFSGFQGFTDLELKILHGYRVRNG